MKPNTYEELKKENKRLRTELDDTIFKLVSSEEQNDQIKTMNIKYYEKLDVISKIRNSDISLEDLDKIYKVINAIKGLLK